MWMLAGFRLALMLGLLFPMLNAAQAADGIEVSGAQVSEYHFGKQATIQATVISTAAVQQISLFLESEGKNTQVIDVPPTPDGKLTIRLDLRQVALRPFARVKFWFKILPENGAAFDSSPSWFDYIDNRFNWQSNTSEVANIYWAEGGQDFGQTAQNVTKDSLTALGTLLPLPQVIPPINIYIYPHAIDLQTGLETNGQNWVAGHASPDLGVILVAVPTGSEQKIEMEQKIPHEMAHVLTYQVVGKAYDRLPVWLVEGMASQVELYPNTDYSRSLEQARLHQTLIPMSTLCLSFPRDASNAFLSYSQSASFVKYLQNTYGSSGLSKLMNFYSDGMGCSEGMYAAFGLSLEQMDTNWRQKILKVNFTELAWVKLSPYMFLFAVIILVPAGLTVLRTREHAALSKGQKQGGQSGE